MTQEPRSPAPVTERSRHLLTGKRLAGVACLAGVAMLLAADPWHLFTEPPGIETPETLYPVLPRAAVDWRHPLPLPADLDPAERAYRRRQERWVLERFEADRAWFVAADAPAQPEASVKILTGPVSPDDTVEDLPPAARAARERDEAHVIVSTLRIFVPGVDARSLMRFHALSRFELTYENPTRTTAIQLYGPRHGTALPHPLAEGFSLPRNQWLRTEATAGSFVKQATRITHAVVLDLEREAPVYRFALFLSDPPEGGADARLSHGLFLTRDVEGGAVLFTRSLFHGQQIPHFGRSVFADLIRSAYVEYGEVYRRHARDWIRAHPERSSAARAVEASATKDERRGG